EQDTSRDSAEEVWSTVHERKRRLQEGYPIQTRDELVFRIPDGWQGCVGFTALLLADLGRFYEDVKVEFEPGGSFPHFFEKIVEASLGGALEGTSVRFGAPAYPGLGDSLRNRVG